MCVCARMYPCILLLQTALYICCLGSEGEGVRLLLCRATVDHERAAFLFSSHKLEG